MLSLIRVTLQSAQSALSSKRGRIDEREFTIVYASPNSMEYAFTEELRGMESEQSILSGLQPRNDIKTEKQEQISKIIRSMLDILGDGYKIMVDPKWPSEDGLAKFHEKWTKIALEESLRNYRIPHKLSYEAALIVLQEHYIVQPMMES